MQFPYGPPHSTCAYPNARVKRRLVDDVPWGPGARRGLSVWLWAQVRRAWQCAFGHMHIRMRRAHGDVHSGMCISKCPRACVGADGRGSRHVGVLAPCTHSRVRRRAVARASHRVHAARICMRGLEGVLAIAFANGGAQVHRPRGLLHSGVRDAARARGGDRDGRSVAWAAAAAIGARRRRVAAVARTRHAARRRCDTRMHFLYGPRPFGAPNAGALACAAMVGGREDAAPVVIEVTLPGLPGALDGFRIVQLSDLHIGPTVGMAICIRECCRMHIRMRPRICIRTCCLMHIRMRGPACLPVHAFTYAAMCISE